MPEVKKKRESWLDACKGIAIVLVVIGHIIDGNMSKGLLSGQTWVVVYNVIYLFHMPLFFVLSGMALAVSKRQNLVNGGGKKLLKFTDIISVLVNIYVYI